MNNTPHGIKQKPGRQLKEQRPVQWWKIKIINIFRTQINKIPIMFEKKKSQSKYWPMRNNYVNKIFLIKKDQGKNSQKIY